MSKSLLLARGIRKDYLMGGSPLRVLRSASLEVTAGEFIAVMGSSGSGKSTLLHILGALDTPDRGTVRFDGADVFAMNTRQRERLRNSDLGFVFQFYHLLPELNVLENVLVPSLVGSSVWGWLQTRHRARESALDVIERVGLTERIKHRPNQLSGGERQRVAIARALVQRPRLLLADEPTGNLDADTGREILGLLTQLNRKGQTIVMVTHDSVVASRAHRILLLADGRLRAGSRTNAASREPPSPVPR